MNKKGFKINEITIGQKYSSKTSITEEMLDKYAEITGDYNPIHFDEVYASKTFFGKKIAHGMILSGFISSIVGMYLPGQGCLYERQDLQFLKPCFVGDTINTIVMVKNIDKSKNRVVLDTKCINQDGVTVLIGTAVVLPRKD